MNQHAESVYDAFAACLGVAPVEQLAILDRLREENPSLHREVQSLLSADERVRRDEFLEVTLSDVELSDDLIGRQAGDYQILELIGRGGMGRVYRARQSSTGRDVAVKFLSLDRVGGHVDVGPELVSRFQTEIHATANLKHDNIVKAYGAGEFQGRLYYAMEYIVGTSLQDKLIEDGGPRSVQPRAAARYMRSVADAIHYAHGQSILHRDLKPHNILVEASSDRPYVADFGLAQAANDDAHPPTLGGPVGTPGFMAPEQASCRPCTEETDVYGLGATLYALLVGRPPFMAASTRETLDQVKHQEPVPPRRHNGVIPSDLEAICLKCLEKHPRKRYRSAAEARDDLQRFLENRPTKARPIGPLQRVWRWSRREPVPATLLATVMLILLTVGIAAALVAERRRILLRQREQLTRDLATSLREQERSTDRAERNFERASQVVADLQRLAQREDIDVQLRKELLEQVDLYLAEFIQQEEGDWRLRAKQADALIRRAQIARMIDSPSEAIDLYEQSIALLRSQIEARPDDLDLLRSLAGAQQDLASARSAGGFSEEAIASGEKSREIFQRLIRRAPDNQQYVEDLAKLLINLGVMSERQSDFSRAEERYDSSLAMLHNLMDEYGDSTRFLSSLTKAHINLASLYNRTGRSEQADEENVKALELLRTLVQRKPDDGDSVHDLALLHINLGLAHQESGDGEKAKQSFQRAADLADKLREVHPKILPYQETAAVAQERLGKLADTTGQLEQAVNGYEHAVEIRQQLLPLRENTPRYLHELTVTYNSLGRVYQRLGKTEEMERSYNEGIRLCHQMSDLGFDQPAVKISLGMFYRALSADAEQRGSLPQALEWSQEAIDTLQPLMRESPPNGFAARLLLEVFIQDANCLDRLERPEEANERWREAIDVYPHAERSPSDGKATADLLFLARLGLSTSLAKAGNYGDAARQAEMIARENTDVHSQFEAARLFAQCALAVQQDSSAAASERTLRSDEYSKSALQCLRTAAQSGFFATAENRRGLDREPAFSNLRNTPIFEAIRNQLAESPKQPKKPDGEDTTAVGATRESSPAAN